MTYSGGRSIELRKIESAVYNNNNNNILPTPLYLYSTQKASVNHSVIVSAFIEMIKIANIQSN